MTLRELAIALGMKAYSHLNRIERGERKPSADLVVKIARLFNVPTDKLMLDELELD